jgi:hypothetical protein
VAVLAGSPHLGSGLCCWRVESLPGPSTALRAPPPQCTQRAFARITDPHPRKWADQSRQPPRTQIVKVPQMTWPSSCLDMPLRSTSHAAAGESSGGSYSPGQILLVHSCVIVCGSSRSAVEVRGNAGLVSDFMDCVRKMRLRAGQNQTCPKPFMSALRVPTSASYRGRDSSSSCLPCYVVVTTIRCSVCSRTAAVSLVRKRFAAGVFGGVPWRVRLQTHSR